MNFNPAILSEIFLGCWKIQINIYREVTETEIYMIDHEDMSVSYKKIPVSTCGCLDFMRKLSKINKDF